MNLDMNLHKQAVWQELMDTQTKLEKALTTTNVTSSLIATLERKISELCHILEKLA